jgi:hypothetical protein
MGDETIHVTVRGDPTDPRSPPDAPGGVIVHRGPPLHPDDITVIDGIPVTSVARTLIDLAEVMNRDELRGCFRAARAKGLLDLDELAASRARDEWRPSLEMLDDVIAEFS